MKRRALSISRSKSGRRADGCAGGGRLGRLGLHRRRARSQELVLEKRERGRVVKLAALVELAPGDLIFTGTPAGVGPIQRGQAVRATIEGLEPLEVTFTA